jgi:hypothetical protein
MGSGARTSTPLPLGIDPFARDQRPSAQTLNAIVRWISEHVDHAVGGDHGLEFRVKLTGNTPPNAILQAKKIRLSWAGVPLSLADTDDTGDSAWTDVLTINGAPLVPAFRIAEISGATKLQIKKVQFDLPPATTSDGTLGLENVPGTADTDYADLLTINVAEYAPSFQVSGGYLQMQKIKLAASGSTLSLAAGTEWVNVIQLAECDTPE